MMALATAQRLYEENREWAAKVANSVLRRVSSPAIERDELHQIAQVKTWDCAITYDPRRWTIAPAGDPFQLFAYPTVSGACMMAAYRPTGRGKARGGASVQMEPITDHATPANQGDVDEALQSGARRELLLDIIHELPKIERHLITEHYLGGVRLVAVAESLHTSQANVSRIHARALGLLRESLSRRGMSSDGWL